MNSSGFCAAPQKQMPMLGVRYAITLSYMW